MHKHNCELDELKKDNGLQKKIFHPCFLVDLVDVWDLQSRRAAVCIEFVVVNL